MSEETPVFDSDRSERAYYESLAPDDLAKLPLTRDGFESLLETCANLSTPPLPITDAMRKVIAGYVHHIDNKIDSVKLTELQTVMHKSVSNALTWTIDQEIKAKEQKELNEKRLQAESVEKERLKLEAIAKAEVKRQRKGMKVVTSRDAQATQQ